ncbi:hypothetical protein [Abyssisolibacter fermentans]|uniref:hypothetical protein n=1 Tax=Abyssisolibacter fermentans TaxID=1766203 RepID=UPI0008370736|nr:hypothetical protein [Abyssisolibacter fermentans]
MQLTQRDIVIKKLLDAQEMVRDYEQFSKEIKDEEIANTFKSFAEESGMQAQKLQGMLDRI